MQSFSRTGCLNSHSTEIRTVDLFCGCGGLTVGFEASLGELRYRTVLGADIDPATLKVFNRNLGQGAGCVPTGRRVDLSWFSHRAEVLLYYLSHFALWHPDEDLEDDLRTLGFHNFLSQVRRLDEAFADDARQLSESAAYQGEWKKVGSSTKTLALYRTVISKLGVNSLGVPGPAATSLPWVEDYAIRKIGAASEHQLALAGLGLVRPSAGDIDPWAHPSSRRPQAVRLNRSGSDGITGQTSCRRFLERRQGQRLGPVACAPRLRRHRPDHHRHRSVRSQQHARRPP
jgi:hypothetical protein